MVRWVMFRVGSASGWIEDDEDGVVNCGVQVRKRGRGGDVVVNRS